MGGSKHCKERVVYSLGQNMPPIRTCLPLPTSRTYLLREEELGSGVGDGHDLGLDLLELVLAQGLGGDDSAGQSLGIEIHNAGEVILQNTREGAEILI